MDANIQIKIDTGVISTLISNKKVLKLYCFFVTLKAINTSKSGLFDYKSNIKEICELMNISQRTFYIRLNACIYHELIKRNDQGLIYLTSYVKASDIFTLNHNKEYIYIDPSDHRLEDQLRAKAIELNIASQLQMVHKKIKESFNTKSSTPEQIRLKLCALLIAGFITGDPLPNLPTNLNPDVTLSQKHTATLYGCKNQSSGYYWQKKLVSISLLEMESRNIESKVYSSTSRLIGKINFNPKTKTKFMQLRNLLKPLL